MYGGATAQYPVYGNGPAGGMMTGGAAAAAYYPYLQYGEGTGGATTGGYTSGQGYGVNYPPQVFQYSPIASTGGYAQHYGTPISLAPSPAALPSGFYFLLYSHDHGFKLGFQCELLFCMIIDQTIANKFIFSSTAI